MSLTYEPSPDHANLPAGAAVLGALQARVAEVLGELDAHQVRGRRRMAWPHISPMYRGR